MTETTFQGEGPTLSEALAAAAAALGVSSASDMDWDYEREHFRGGAYSVLVTAKPLDPEVLKQRKADDAVVSAGKTWLRQLMDRFHNDPGLKIHRRGETVVLDIMDAEDARLFIGREGKNIPAFQHLFSKVMAKAGVDAKVMLDFDGYTGDRDSDLEGDIQAAIAEALETGETVTLRPMNSYERHLAHSMVKDAGGLKSKSDGEGTLKQVMIRVLDED